MSARLRYTVMSMPIRSIYCAAVSPAKTCRARASELALLVIEAACGSNLIALSDSYTPGSSSSKMSPAELPCGLIVFRTTWDDAATRRYRSRLKRAMSGRSTEGPGSSSSGGLPTLTNARNALSPDSQKWPAHRLLRERLERTGELPTLTAQRYGTAQNGNPGDSREAYATKGNPSIHSLAGAPLNPSWCEWFMGFPIGWTDVKPPEEGTRLVTVSFRSVRKLLGMF